MIDILFQNTECKTFAIDGAWGTGKSVLVYQLLYLLKHSDEYEKPVSDEEEKCEVSKVCGLFLMHGKMV